MSTDLLYPVLIGAGCILLVVAVHLLTRPKPSRSDITVPASNALVATSRPAAPPEPMKQLGTWHVEHEATLLDFFDKHDRDVGAVGAGARTATTRARGEQVTAAFEQAIDDHPAPDMRAELAALRTAADSLRLAEERGDSPSIARHQEVYGRYRAAWLERLSQFPGNRSRVDSVRARKIRT